MGSMDKEEKYLSVWNEEEYKKKIIEGMGEMKIEIIVESMKSELKVEEKVGKKKVD